MANQDSSPQQSGGKNSLDEHFAAFAARVEKIDEAIDVNDPESLVVARDNLAGIIRELKEIHVEEIDVASSAGAEDNSSQFLLTKEIANLLHQTQQLYDVLNLTIEKSTSQQQTSQNEENGESVDSSGDDKPLSREEIAKLLLLISRAHGIGQLSDEQKHNLKVSVCHRKSYLRFILRQSDITQIMAALAEAGGGK